MPEQIGAEAESELAAWKLRLPEVPPAVPEVRDTFGASTGPAFLAAVSSGFFLGGSSVASWILIGWMIRGADILTHNLDLPLVVASLAFLPLRIALGVGLFLSAVFLSEYFSMRYVRYVFLRGNNRSSAILGGAVAGFLATSIFLWLTYILRSWDTSGWWERILSPEASFEDWLRGASFPFLICFFAIGFYPTMVWDALDPRRHCPVCGDSMPTLALQGITLGQAARFVEQFDACDPGDIDEPELKEGDEVNTGLYAAGADLLIRGCNRCGVRLLEGTATVAPGGRSRRPPFLRYEVEWRFLSRLLPMEAIARLEAKSQPTTRWLRRIWPP